MPDKKYDLIVTNPPYVNCDSMGKLPQEYLREPQIALAGGNDGMDLVRKIVDGAAEHLTPEGILMVEIGNEREYAEAAFGRPGPDLADHQRRRRHGVPAHRRPAEEVIRNGVPRCMRRTRVAARRAIDAAGSRLHRHYID